MDKNVKLSCANDRWHLRTLSVAKAQDINSARRNVKYIDIKKPSEKKAEIFQIINEGLRITTCLNIKSSTVIEGSIVKILF